LGWRLLQLTFIETIMNTYSVYLSPVSSLSNDQSAIKFLVDGNALFAVLLPPVWLAWNRLWWALGIYLSLFVIILLMVTTPWRDAALFLSLIPGMYLWLEGNELIRQRYERRGWRFVGVVRGTDEEEAEMRYFDSKSAQATHSLPQAENISSSAETHRQPVQQPSIGLFPLEN